MAEIARSPIVVAQPATLLPAGFEDVDVAILAWLAAEARRMRPRLCRCQCTAPQFSASCTESGSGGQSDRPSRKSGGVEIADIAHHLHIEHGHEPIGRGVGDQHAAAHYSAPRRPATPPRAPGR